MTHFKFDDEEDQAKGDTLQELMQIMGQMEASKLPKKQIDPNAAAGEGAVPGMPQLDPNSAVREGEMSLPPGMDPRLVEIIKKKKAGMAY